MTARRLSCGRFAGLGVGRAHRYGMMAALCAWSAHAAHAQSPAPAAAPPNDPPPTLKARVIEVAGSVEYAAAGADPLDAQAWKPVEADMELDVDTQVRTGLRSRCVLMFGDAPDQTVISLRRATLASIRDFSRTPTEQRVRIDLGYGAVRGGSSEGTLRSDVVVDSTVATLAKRGTEGFEIEVEPITGRFRLSLARSGLVEAYAKALARRRDVGPGEYVTDMTIARLWINQTIFDRAVRFHELEAVTPADANFLLEHTTGLGNVGPIGPAPGFIVQRRPFGNAVFSDALNRFAVTKGLETVLVQRIALNRPEGNFGFRPTFRILAPHRR